MPHILAQVVLPYYTNLPKDVAVNTFHFDSDVARNLVQSDICDMVVDFYTKTNSPRSYSVGHYMSPVISRTANACVVRLYDQSDPKPRPPFYSRVFTLSGPRGTDNGLMQEVCAVASFQGLREAGLPQRRRRGRVYIGPLNATAVVFSNATRMPKLDEEFSATLRDASEKMAEDSTATDARWSVYSRANTNLVPVYSGWVDNEADTQRRRQARATIRDTWSITI